ncbi:MAG: hypothetical protein O6931_00635 [Gammaproteobacteria bacterium]|nr:hypothetical protein [Gammaproteobacteria bacterium]
MRMFSAWLVQLIALTATGVAYGQEHFELRPAVGDGCDQSSCEHDTLNAPTRQLTPLDWRAFQLHPILNVDPLVIRQDSMLMEPGEFNRRDYYPQVLEERSWAQNLSGIQELRIITLWRNPGSKIFLGIDNNGFAGLNFSQNSRHKSAVVTGQAASATSRPIGPLSPPLVHAQSLTYQKKDLSNALRAE